MRERPVAQEDRADRLDQLMSQTHPLPLYRRANSEEFRAALEKVSEGTQPRPPVPDEAFTAEQMYGDTS